MDSVPTKAIGYLWRAAGFLAPYLRRWFRHRWFFRFHKFLAFLLFSISVAAGWALYHVPWTLLKVPYAGVWPWPSLLPALLIVATYLRMTFEKPRIPHMNLMRDALAVQKGAAQAPIGQIWWDDIPQLANRPQVRTVIEKWKGGTSLVLLEGYSASGKSCIAAMAGRQAAQSGSRLVPAFVYYLNLTTHQGWTGPPRERASQAIAEAVKAASRLPGFRVYFIVEDVHHEFRDLDPQLQRFADDPNARMLLTSRPLERYDLKAPGEGGWRGRASWAFAWLGDGRLGPLETDKDAVETIIKARGGTFCDIDAVLGFVGTKEPNLLLLSLAIQAAARQRKRLDDVTDADIREGLHDHWADVADRPGVNRAAVLRALESVSVLSEFEVPVSRSFVEQTSAGNGDDVGRALDTLTKAREMVSIVESGARPSEYFVLPHARLAQAHRRLSVSDTRRLEVLGQYLAAEPFIGALACRLCLEAPDCLEALVAQYPPTILERILAEASLNEVGEFLQGVVVHSRDLGRKIAQRHRKKILARSLADASLDDVSRFLRRVAIASQDLAREVARRHALDIGQSLTKAALSHVGWFLGRVAAVSDELAREVAQRHALDIGQSLAKAALIDAGWFLRNMPAGSDDQLAWEVAQCHRKEIVGHSLARTSLEEVSWFLGSVAGASDELAREVAQRHALDIGQSLAKAAWNDVGTFLQSMAIHSRDLAQELAQRHREAIVGCSLAHASIVDVRWFLRIVAMLCEDLAREVAQWHALDIGASLTKASLYGVGQFLGGVAGASEAVARELAQRYEAQIRDAYRRTSSEGKRSFCALVPGWLLTLLDLPQD
jgi:hypothetical protein